MITDDSQWVPASDPSLPTYTEHDIIQASTVFTGQTLVFTGNIHVQLHGSDGSLLFANIVEHATANGIDVINNPDGTTTVMFVRLTGQVSC
jgi:hypothetical protein